LQTLRNLARQNNWARVLSTGIGMVRDLQDPRTLVAPLHLPSLPQEVQLLLARAELESGCHEQARRRLHALIEQCARFRFLPLEAEARAVLARLPDDYPTPVCEGDSCLEELTVREVSVLRLLAKGMTNQEIADNLFLSVNTVKFHAKNINGKLGTSRRTQAIDLARGMGILA
jgi:ATP/maltotriose-dependent transcriptional regulator MalT